MTQQTLSTFWQWAVRIAWASYVVVLMTLTHMPIPERVAVVTSPMDKSIHLVAYAILAILTAAVFVKTDPLKLNKPKLFWSLLVFAALDEILQGPVGRSPDMLDWIYDCAGIGMGLMTAQVLIWWVVEHDWFRLFGLELKLDR